MNLTARASSCCAWLLLAACAATPEPPAWAATARAACHSAQGTCPPALVPDLPLAVLQAKGSVLEVDCGLEFIDYSLDSAYAACERNVLAAMDSLVARWPERLAPVLPGDLQYGLVDMGCITLTTGYCACPYEGTARAPLKWLPGAQAVD